MWSIKKRNRNGEDNYSKEYLIHLSNTYDKTFENIKYNTLKLDWNGELNITNTLKEIIKNI